MRYERFNQFISSLNFEELKDFKKKFDKEHAKIRHDHEKASFVDCNIISLSIQQRWILLDTEYMGSQNPASRKGHARSVGNYNNEMLHEINRDIRRELENADIIGNIDDDLLMKICDDVIKNQSIDVL